MQLKRIYKRSFLMPAVILYTVLFVIPCIMGIAYSFTNWNSMSQNIKFIGLQNYIDIFTSENSYVLSIKNTLIFTVFASFLKIVISLAFALFLNRDFKTQSLLRGIYFMPFAISSLIIGIIFTSVLAPDGILNIFLRVIGLGSLATSWLSNIKTALWSTIAVEIWKSIGLNMVIFLAGLQMIDKTYYEAADIDGANKWKSFLNITIPFLIPSVAINLVLNIIHGLKVFDIIVALTNGGPGSATQVINTNVFKTYSMGAYGLSTALSTIIFILTTIIAMMTFKLIAPKEA